MSPNGAADPLVRTLPTLADRIPIEDLAQFVLWFADEEDRWAHYGDLPGGLLRRAWSRVEHVEIRQALAHLIASVFGRGAWIHGRQQHPHPMWTEQSDEVRRALACDIAVIGAIGWLPVISLGLLTPSDISWLQQVLPTAGDPLKSALTACLQQLEAAQHQPVPIEIDLPDYEPPGIEDFHALLQQLGSDSSLWPGVLTALDGESAMYEEQDLLARDGWRRLEKAQRTELLLLGVVFLHEHQPDARSWCGSAMFTPEQVYADWSGVHLMAAFALHAPAVLTEIPGEVWERWAHCIVAAHVYGPREENSARVHLLQASLEHAREQILATALDHIDHLAEEVHELYPLLTYQCLAADLAGEIGERLVAGRYSGQLARSLLDTLVEAEPISAAATCRLLVAAGGPLAAQAWEHLSAIDPNYVVDELTNNPTPERVSVVVDDLDIPGLDTNGLSKAARLLLDTVPFDNDERLDPNGSLSARIDLQWVRDRVLHLLSDAGQAEALSALATGRSALSRRILARYFRHAESRSADFDVPLIQPATLLKLLRTSDSLLVRNNADLVSVMVRQFDDLQHYLHHQDGWRELWQGDSPPGEDDVSDWLRHRLLDRLDKSCVLVDRENQIARPKGSGIGTRVDITPTCRTVQGGLTRIFIEAKRSNSGQLYTALRAQLINQYLIPAQLRHGIYIVYWIAPKLRPDTWSSTKAADPAALLKRLQKQAEKARGEGFEVTPYVLDLRPVIQGKTVTPPSQE